MSVFNEMLDAMNDPQSRHAAMVHIPIALAFIGVLLALVSACAVKSAMLRWMTFTAYMLLAVSGWYAAESGENADNALGQLAPHVAEIVEDHEHKAEWVWKFAGGVALLCLISAVPRMKIRVMASLLALLGALFTAGWVSYTGHLGGTLVYDHGVGTPDLEDPAAAEPAEPAEPAETPPDTAGADPVVPPAQPAAQPASDPRAAFFVAEVHPVLAEYCVHCHDRNSNRFARVGKLDLTTIGGVLAGGESGLAVVPGKPEESLLITAVKHEDDFVMPADEEDRLPDEVIAKLEQWVRDGAVWVDVPGDGG